MTTQDFITYVIAQVLSAIAGAVVLYLILSGKLRAGMAASAKTAGDPAISASTAWARR
jgi:glycerol uptake facilitator-like aquaporin